MAILALTLSGVYFFQYIRTKQVRFEYLAYLWLIIAAAGLYIQVNYSMDMLSTHP